VPINIPFLKQLARHKQQGREALKCSQYLVLLKIAFGKLGGGDIKNIIR